MKTFFNSHSYTKTGILSRFFRIFLFMIILPTIIIWMIYLFILNNYFSRNTLSVQQTYLENSISSLNLSISNVETIFAALNSIPDITYYLDFYSEKRDMLYSLKKTIHQQCSVLTDSNDSITSISIYSKNDNILFADPFCPMKDIPLSESQLQHLDSAYPSDILWNIVPSDINTIPELYAYQKLYATNYSSLLGYKELRLNPVIIEAFISQFENNTSLHNGKFALYLDNELIYSRTDPEILPDKELLDSFTENTYQIDYLKDQYINYVAIPDLNLQLVLIGSFSGLSNTPNESLTILISVFIVIILGLFILFFQSVINLSRQIMDFSKHIYNSDPDNLQIYTITEKQYRHEYEELLHLIHSYNNLIQENSTLMSQVRKMELLSQEASYQSLQAQIHPHFIYGTLENIRMLAIQNRDKDVADMIYSLSSLLRHSLSISDRAVTLDDEIKTSTHYLRIQKVRFGDRLSYHFRVDESLLKLKLPPFTLQPILENSIIYGVSNTLDSCDLQLSAYHDDKNIMIEISNPGVFIKEDRLDEINAMLKGTGKLSSSQNTHNGIALYNINERLQILFHKKAELHMETSENRTKTIICIERNAAHVSNTDC